MRFRLKLFISIGLLAVVTLIGVVGYMLLSDDSWIDSLYMTIITMTTVGFGEVHPLDNNEKLFTIFLILISIVVYAYSVTGLTEHLANGNFFQRIKDKKVLQKIKKLRNHTVVCGYGRNGKQAVVTLENYDMPCVVIEKDKDLLAELDIRNILYIEGDAIDDESLEMAGVEKAKSLITALPSDADNLFVVLSARQLNANLSIISRASNESSCKKLTIAGATNIIMPDKIGGEHMASLVVLPDLVEFVDRLTISTEGSANLKEIHINDLPSEFLNKTILDLDLRKKTGCTVIGFKTASNEYIINPEAKTKLTLDSNLIVLGRPNQIQQLTQIL